jgi:hypothetical protein
MGSTSGFNGVAFQSRDEIVAAGSWTDGDSRRKWLVARFASNGELDGSFGEGGLVRTEISRHSYAWGLLVQPDRRLVVTGGSHDEVAVRFTLVRYLG